MRAVGGIQKAGKRVVRALLVLCLLLFIGGLLVFAEWRQATPGYDFQFDRDHASHPDYKIEWWYYTGNLNSADGRRFGYQLTFFRVGIDQSPVNQSRWAVRDLFMAHFAITDISGKQFRYAERLNRAGIGWAGASTDTYKVWNEDWEATLDAQNHHLLKASDLDERIAIELDLAQGKAPVLQGERGYSQKGTAQGNASNYYSLTRMPTRGAITIDGQRFEISGSSWMDHEFGTSFLEAKQIGWDWASIQLDDETELMLYQFRRSDNKRDPHSSGTFIDAQGNATLIKVDEFVFEPAGEIWRSSASGASYPIAWRAQVPNRKIDLTLRAAVENQELNTGASTGVNYWEGAIEVIGTREGKAISGRGYLEMTGYSGAAMGVVLGENR
ncbi:MAG TPA: lipocalin-like domain-containing protein [Blastocatellia bacterium]|nr:lipocalin-like domain-containing protein [Blastocatellia bacterium]